MRQQLGREAFGQPVTGQFQHLLQATQAHALQALNQLARQAAARHRQTLQLGLQRLLVHRQPVRHVGQHPGRQRVGRQHQPMLKAQRLQLGAQTLLKFRPGTEQTQTGGHLQQQGAGEIQTNMTTEAVRPTGQKLLPMLGLCRVVLDRIKALQQHARVGQTLS